MFNRRLLALVPNARLPLIGSVLCIVLAICAQAEVFIHLALILEQISEASSLAGEWVRPLQGALVAFVAFFVFSVLARWCAARSGAATKATVSQLLFDKLVALDAPYTLRARNSELVQLFGEGTEALSAYMSRYVPQFFCAVIVPVVLAIIIGRTSVISAFVMLICCFCIPVCIMRFMKRAKEKVGEQWGTYTNLGASFHDAISGLSTLKVYGTDAEKHWALNDQAENFRAATMRLLHIQLNSVTFMDLFTYVGIALGCGVALLQMYFGQLDTAAVFSIILTAPLFFSSMRTFGSLFHTGMNGDDVAQALFAVLDVDEQAKGRSGCEETYPSISCKNLSYSYDGERDTLVDVNLDIPANSIVGITGESGAGKSTWARVLTGIAAPYRGSVKVGGVELSEMDPMSLHELVTFVSKESHLFKGTIRSNMLMADTEVSDAYIWDALHRARIADEVLAAGGLDAPVEAGGVNFSGGQRQRLCFARAILRDTPIYIFDEAASNVDAESEKLLYNIMHEIAFTKTVIVISHRLRMLTWVDELFVFDDARLVQHGAPAALLAQTGPYKQLWERYAALEDFAAQIASEDEGEVAAVELSPLEEVVAGLPGMAQTAMQAVLDAKKLQKYLAGSDGSIPNGHPAWIPLPASYKAALLEEAATESTEEDLDANNVEDAVSVRAAAQEETKPLRSLASTVKELTRLTVPMRSDLKEALFAGFASNLAAVALIGFASYALLCAINLMSPAGFIVALLGMLLCGLARGPLHYGERLYTHDQTFKTLALVRSKVFEAMRKLAPAKLESHDAGDLISLVTSDVELLEGFYSRTLTPALSALLCALAVSVGAAIASPILGGILVLCCILCGVVVPLFVERAGQVRGAQVRDFAVAMQSFLFDSLDGFVDLLQFGRAQEYAEEMHVHFNTLQAGEGSVGLRNALLSALSAGCALLLQVGVVLAAWFVVSAHLSGVASALLVAAFGLATLSALAEVGQWSASFSQTHAAASRILDLLDEMPQVPEVKQGVKLEEFSGAAAQDVGFAYGEEPVLSGVNLEIAPGEAVRVVGESGVGKTTLLRLFMRFWDPQTGQIRLSGTDITDITTSNLRAQESFMTQDTYLFHATLRNNIKVAKLDASAEELDAAIEAAALQGVVERLPQGLDTLLGAGEAQLSEGERQRVGLARAFLHDAPFMILDEPTSNLDTINEAAILYSLAANTKGKTILVASHRPTMAVIADTTLTL